jgi:HK97 family phage prohead protease
MKEVKDFKFQFKDVAEDGTFSGLAAVYNNVDLGGDVIEPGAFAKTIADNNGEVPILWQHNADEPIGMGKVTDGPDGLKIEGTLFVAESDVAKKAYGLMKRGVLKGLSIGYDAVQKTIKDGIRHLNELKLWEVSTVTFPMNTRALVSAVKSDADLLEQAAKALQERAQEIKAGRTLSGATRDRLQSSMDSMKQAMDHISALMAEDDASKSAAKQRDAEPGLHSAIDSLKATLDKFIA